MGRVITQMMHADTVCALAKVHAQLSCSQLPCNHGLRADRACWESIDILQRLIRARPGLVGLGTAPISSVTTQHPHHPGDVPVNAVNHQGIDGRLFVEQQAQLLAPTHLLSQEAELFAAGARGAPV